MSETTTDRGQLLAEAHHRTRQQYDGHHRLAAAVLVQAWRRFDRITESLSDPIGYRWMDIETRCGLQDEALEIAAFLCAPSPFHELVGKGPDQWKKLIRQRAREIADLSLSDAEMSPDITEDETASDRGGSSACATSARRRLADEDVAWAHALK